MTQPAPPTTQSVGPPSRGSTRSYQRRKKNYENADCGELWARKGHWWNPDDLFTVEFVKFAKWTKHEGMLQWMYGVRWFLYSGDQDTIEPESVFINPQATLSRFWASTPLGRRPLPGERFRKGKIIRSSNDYRIICTAETHAANRALHEEDGGSHPPSSPSAGSSSSTLSPTESEDEVRLVLRLPGKRTINFDDTLLEPEVMDLNEPSEPNRPDETNQSMVVDPKIPNDTHLELFGPDPSEPDVDSDPSDPISHPAVRPTTVNPLDTILPYHRRVLSSKGNITRASGSGGGHGHSYSQTILSHTQLSRNYHSRDASIHGSTRAPGVFRSTTVSLRDRETFAVQATVQPARENRKVKFMPTPFNDDNARTRAYSAKLNQPPSSMQLASQLSYNFMFPAPSQPFPFPFQPPLQLPFPISTPQNQQVIADVAMDNQGAGDRQSESGEGPEAEAQLITLMDEIMEPEIVPIKYLS